MALRLVSGYGECNWQGIECHRKSVVVVQRLYGNRERRASRRLRKNADSSQQRAVSVPRYEVREVNRPERYRAVGKR